MPDPVAWLVDKLHLPTSDSNKGNKNPLFTNDPAPKPSTGDAQAAAGAATPGATGPESPAYQTLFNPLAIQTFLTQFLAPYINKGGGAQGTAQQLGKMGFKVNPSLVQSAQDVQGADLAALLHQVDPKTIQFLQDYTNQMSQVKSTNQALRDNYMYDLRNYLSGTTGSGGVPGTSVSGANLIPAIQNLIQQPPQQTQQQPTGN